MAYTEGIIYGTTSNKYIACKANWRATTNDLENYSEVAVNVYYWRTNSGYTTQGKWNGSITVNGETFYDETSKVVLSYNSNTWVSSHTFIVRHNADGTKSCAISVNGGISGTSLTATYLSGTIVLPDIARQATITSAPDFNDEQNPTITYTNKVGNGVSSLQACISLTGAKDDIAYRDISKTGSSYTFNLTEAERNILRAATTGKTRAVRFYVKTVLNGETFLSVIGKTFSITNGSPTLAPTIYDIDAVTLALTGNKERFIKYFSNAQFTTGAKAVKEATLVSQKITCGGLSSTAGSGVLYNVESGSFTITATDSRGFTATKTVNKTLIEYVKLTCNIAPTLPNALGSMTLTIKGNYYNGGFGAVDNTINLYYRIKQNDNEYGEWLAATATLNDNTYSVTIPITGLDYQSKYTLQAKAEDKLMVVESAEKSVKSIPVFDWSKEDFNVNGLLNIKNKTVLRNNGDNNNIILSAESATDGVFIRPNGTGSNEAQTIFYKNGDLSVNGVLLGKNKVLWSGASYMTTSQTIDLSEAVNKQANGIVLVFSRFSNGSAENSNFNSFFVPKYLVSAHGGAGQVFSMTTVNYSLACCKYLYINNSSISGNDLNTSTGTGANGIKYANDTYVLRYVIGV